MSSRVSPSEQIRASIDALFADPDRELGAVLEDVARPSVRDIAAALAETLPTRIAGRND